MKRFSELAESVEPWAYAALRIVVGAMLCCHGIGKLFGGLGPPHPEALSQLWIGGVIEFVGGELVALGLCTRCAAFVASCMLAVAYFQFHWKLHTGDLQFLPIINKGELAVAYCFVFFYIFARGPGRLSLDGVIRGRRGTASRAG